MGFVECEKTPLSEEGIGPASLIIDAAALAGSAGLLAQEPSQTTTDKAVQIP